MSSNNNFYSSSNSSHNPLPNFQPRPNGFPISSQFYSLTPNASTRPEKIFDFKEKNKAMFQSTINYNGNGEFSSNPNSFNKGVPESSQEFNRTGFNNGNQYDNFSHQESHRRVRDAKMASSAIFSLNNQSQQNFDRFPSFNLKLNQQGNNETKQINENSSNSQVNHPLNESLKQKRQREIAAIKKQVEFLNKKMLSKPLSNVLTSAQQFKSPRYGSTQQSAMANPTYTNFGNSYAQSNNGFTETSPNYNNIQQSSFLNRNKKIQTVTPGPSYEQTQYAKTHQDSYLDSMKPYPESKYSYEKKDGHTYNQNQLEGRYKGNPSQISHVKSSGSIPTVNIIRQAVMDPEVTKNYKFDYKPKQDFKSTLYPSNTQIYPSNNISNTPNSQGDRNKPFSTFTNDPSSLQQTFFKKKKFYEIEVQAKKPEINYAGTKKQQSRDLHVVTYPKISAPNTSEHVSHKLRKTDSLNYIDESIPLPEVKSFKLSDFIIGKKMGKGQFGQVLLVRHKLTGWLCGLKVMEKKDIRDQEYVDQIARQLSIQFYLQHRNIAQLYGYFEQGTKFYLLIQFCAGGQLLQKIRTQKRMKQKDVSKIIRQVCEGVDYIHKQQIIHRDLKPENILFNFDTVKISDFGWAVYRGFGMRKTVSGSPLYYPPQIVKGEQYDDKIDVWNIGMMAYECLEGKIPFKVYSQMDLGRIVSDEISFPSYVDISENAKDFILKTMKKKGQDRIQIRQMLRHQLLANSNLPQVSQQVLVEFHRVLQA